MIAARTRERGFHPPNVFQHIFPEETASGLYKESQLIKSTIAVLNRMKGVSTHLRKKKQIFKLSVAPEHQFINFFFSDVRAMWQSIFHSTRPQSKTR